MKIVDCFIFYNELDLLRVRFEELYNVVDYFVLVEGTLTFTGNAKKLYYNENKELFDKYNDKVVHVIVDDFPITDDPWTREFYQRNSIVRGTSRLELTDDDIIIITDVDEIPSFDLVKSIKNKTLVINNDTIWSIEMTLYYYTLEWTTPNKWYHPKLLNFSTYSILKSPSRIRMIHTQMPTDVIENGGWHITYYGDVNYIINKLESFSEQTDNNLENKNVDYLHKCISTGMLHFNKTPLVYEKIENNRNLPYSLITDYIPKVAFTFWEGNELSYLQYYTIYSFCKYNPLYDVIIYVTEHNADHFVHPSNHIINADKQISIYDFLNIKNVKIVKIDLNKYNVPVNMSPILKADIVRIVKLYEHGGVWIDLDILFIKPLPDELLRVTNNIGYFKYGGTVATGLILSSPKNKCIEYIYNYCLNKIQSSLHDKDLQCFGPSLWRDCIFNNYNLFKDCIIINNDVVYPYMWDQPQILFFTNNDYVADNTICIHWYNGATYSRKYINTFDRNNIVPDNCVFEKYLHQVLYT